MSLFFTRKLNKHAKLMQKFASQQSMHFAKQDDFGQYRLLKDFKLFKRGHSRKVCNLASQKDDIKTVNIFDYRYVISGGNSHIPFYQTVFFIQSPHLNLPYFRIVPRKFYHRLLEWIGFDDDLDYNNEAIEKHYRIHTDVSALFEKNFNEATRQYLALHPEWTVEGLGYFLIAYRRKKLLSLKDLQALKKYGIELFELIKNKAPIEPL